MDRSVCSELMQCLSLEQVSAVAIHIRVQQKQTGQGQLYFPLEKCIIQRKGIKSSKTLMTQSTFHFMEQQSYSVFSRSRDMKTKSLCRFITCEKPDLLK